MTDQAVLDAKDIIAKNLYATVGTVCPDGSPWSSPVYICHDNELNFYWASAVQSQHSQNIAANGHAFLTLFDSHNPWGQGKGIYMTARAIALEEEKEIVAACELRAKKVPASAQPAALFTGDSPRRIYKATPIKIWRNGFVLQNGRWVDVRAEIQKDGLSAQLEIL